MNEMPPYGPFDRLTEAFHQEPTFGHGAVDTAVDCWHCREIVAALADRAMTSTGCSSCGFPLWSPPGVRCGHSSAHDWPPSRRTLADEVAAGLHDQPHP